MSKNGRLTVQYFRIHFRNHSSPVLAKIVVRKLPLLHPLGQLHGCNQSWAPTVKILLIIIYFHKNPLNKKIYINKEGTLLYLIYIYVAIHHSHSLSKRKYLQTGSRPFTIAVYAHNERFYNREGNMLILFTT